MPISKLMTCEYIKHELHVSNLVPHGTCGNCNSAAFDVVARICKPCAKYFNINTFPEYTYPSELMYRDNIQLHLVRAYVLYGDY